MYTVPSLDISSHMNLSRVMDPDPDWIRIGSGFNDFVDPDSESGFGLRIRNPNPNTWARKMKKKMQKFLNFINIFIAKRSEIVQTTTNF
jgi:hypothetical protein